MKIILDNGHIMHYNNHCSAGVAHLVERDLAKVEVASSSLVARSKKKHHPNRMVFLFGMLRAGPNSLPRPARSALNQEVRQGSCEWLRHSWDAGSESSLVTFFAFAVCGDADNKSSGQSKRNTIPTGWCFFAFTGPPAICSPSCRQHKSVVFLRRFCLARKMEQGTLFNYLLYFFFLLTTVVPMAAPPLINSNASHKAKLLESPVCGDLESSFSFAVTVSAFLISFVPSLSL